MILWVDSRLTRDKASDNRWESLDVDDSSISNNSEIERDHANSHEVIIDVRNYGEARTMSQVSYGICH